ncbi:prefoldin subunit superfamily protein [Babesia caballi]|uniref:Prefoldin subunit superfamily protein n=1 Tax=Babesia caballi TaxID=5871 RepID=A0AAV4LSX6_BABCB|nr:prefoldin subunit superfamily protein [Babesia caballi]
MRATRDDGGLQTDSGVAFCSRHGLAKVRHVYHLREPSEIAGLNQFEPHFKFAIEAAHDRFKRVHRAAIRGASHGSHIASVGGPVIAISTMGTSSSGYDGLVTYVENRKVPAAKYVADIEKLVGDQDPAAVTNSGKELLAKYRFMEKSMATKLTALNNKVPELKDALTIIEHIDKRGSEGAGDIYTYFKVSDTLYSEARISSTKTIFLWLGTNTMVEYPVEEATALLQNQIKLAMESIEDIKTNLEWVRNQITSTEVTVARLHNYSVMKGSASAVAPSSS